MSVDSKGYGGVRYALRPKESKDVKKLIRQYGGLTHEEIRQLAEKLGVSSKPIQNALNELHLPILTRRSAPIPISILPNHVQAKAPTSERSQSEQPYDGHDIDSLWRENERLKKEIVEHRRMRAQADKDLVRARKSLLETAELRRRHQEEQAALEDPRKQIEELTDTLRICRNVLLSLCGRYAEIVTRLPLPQLEELIKRAQAELKRRRSGARRRQWP